MLLGIREEDRFGLDELVHLVVIGVPSIEWRETDDHLVRQNTEGPPVDRERMTLLGQYFRRQVLWRSTERIGLLILLKDLGQPEVGQADVAIFTHENVFWLQISIDDLL